MLFNIQRFALHDGPGIRTTIFLKGCPLRCKWCHNPESLNPGTSDGVGETMTAEQVMKEIEKETIFYDESGGGVTFSGGEPLMQPEFLDALMDKCRQKDIHIALDTTGCVSPQVFDSLAAKADLFLYDLKIIDDAGHKKFTGSSNKYALQNLETLSKKGKRVIIRFPLIPGITDTNENVTAVAAFVSSLKGIHDINVLPYHETAQHKYRRLNLDYEMEGVTPPSPVHTKEVKKLFETYGLNVI
ncbi:MAG: pyruvate formate lyase activating enzyme [Acidobacteriota bacterium]|nr:pyruvate formate lyase activating enzyme [Acidobacteriota bacterium]